MKLNTIISLLNNKIFQKNNTIPILKRDLHRYNMKITRIRGIKHLTSTLHTPRIHLDASSRVSFDQDRPVISRLMNGRQRAS